MKKYEMFGPNVADKYALAITKIFGLGCNSKPELYYHVSVLRGSAPHVFSKICKILSRFSVAPWDDVLYSFTVGARFFGPFQAGDAEVSCSSQKRAKLKSIFF